MAEISLEAVHRVMIAPLPSKVPMTARDRELDLSFPSSHSGLSLWRRRRFRLHLVARGVPGLSQRPQACRFRAERGFVFRLVIDAPRGFAGALIEQEGLPRDGLSVYFDGCFDHLSFLAQFRTADVPRTTYWSGPDKWSPFVGNGLTTTLYWRSAIAALKRKSVKGPRKFRNGGHAEAKQRPLPWPQMRLSPILRQRNSILSD
jgi:hypothetical protein